jgi:hypothetical protein
LFSFLSNDASPSSVEFKYITIIILDIFHRPVFYLQHGVSETGFCLWSKTSSTYWAQLSKFLLRTGTEPSLRIAMF